MFENMTTNHRAVTSADAHVTIFSVLLTPEANIDKKQQKNFSKSGNVSLCGDVSRCPRNNFQRSIFTKSKDINKNKKKFENLAKNYCAVTSADAHVTIFSVLPSPETEILTKNEGRIFENSTTYHCAVTKADAYVTIFSVLLSPEAEILTKTKKNF
ncbi:hypothetical protein PUN28_020378 [Cardiocondyla obscurior]|uniref:Uncharacterized protein n=1 Tax=Cardiocondyla obscurior TaxID=286306 RepID=A0AAW2E9I1_9HYME